MIDQMRSSQPAIACPTSSGLQWLDAQWATVERLLRRIVLVHGAWCCKQLAPLPADRGYDC